MCTEKKGERIIDFYFVLLETPTMCTLHTMFPLYIIHYTQKETESSVLLFAITIKDLNILKTRHIHYENHLAVNLVYLPSEQRKSRSKMFYYKRK